MSKSAIPVSESTTPRRRSRRLKGEQATQASADPEWTVGPEEAKRGGLAAGVNRARRQADDDEQREESWAIQVQRTADEDAKDELVNFDLAKETSATVEDEQEALDDVAPDPATPGTASQGTRQIKPTRVVSWANFVKAPCASTPSFKKPYLCDYGTMVVPNGPKRRDSIHPRATPSQTQKRVDRFDLTSSEALGTVGPPLKKPKLNPDLGFPYTRTSPESGPRAGSRERQNNSQRTYGSRSAASSVNAEPRKGNVLDAFHSANEQKMVDDMLHGGKGKRYKPLDQSRGTSRQSTLDISDDDAIVDVGHGLTLMEEKKPQPKPSYAGSANRMPARSKEEIKLQQRSQRKVLDVHLSTSPYFPNSERPTNGGSRRPMVGGGNSTSQQRLRNDMQSSTGSKRNSDYIEEIDDDDDDPTKRPRRESHSQHPPSSSLTKAGDIKPTFRSKSTGMFKKASEAETERTQAKFLVSRVKSQGDSYLNHRRQPAAFMWSITQKALVLVDHGKEPYKTLTIDANKIVRIICPDEGDGRLFIHQSPPMPILLLVELYEPDQSAELLEFLQKLASFRIDRVSSEKMTAVFRKKEEELDTWHARSLGQMPVKAQQHHEDPEDVIRRQQNRVASPGAQHNRTDADSGPQKKLTAPLTREMKTKESRPAKARERPQIFTGAEFDRPATRSSRSQHIIEPQRSPSATLESWTDTNRRWQEEHWKGDEPLIYPPEGDKRATVDRRDIERLNEGEFLNDNLLQFYLRYLEENVKTKNPEVAKRVLFMNPFFYQRLTRGKGKLHIDYDGIKRWTSKFDIFKYDYVIVPVNEHAHWYLAVICNTPQFLKPPREDEDRVDEIDTSEADTSLLEVVDDSAAAKNAEADFTADVQQKVNSLTIEDTINIAEDETATGEPAPATSLKREKKKKKAHPPPRKYKPHEPRIITMDSLGFSHSPTCSNLRDFLIAEAKARHNVEVVREKSVGMTAKNIPEQNNHCDCGLFLLGYVKYFLDDPDGMMHDLMQQKREVADRFSKLDAPKMRAEIRQLLFDLKKEQDRQQAAKDASIAAKRLAKKDDGAIHSLPPKTEATPASSPEISGAASSDENKSAAPHASQKSSIEPPDEESLIEVEKPATPAPKTIEKRSSSPNADFRCLMDEIAGMPVEPQYHLEHHQPTPESAEFVGVRPRDSPLPKPPARQECHLTTSKSLECMGSQALREPSVGEGPEFAARNALKATRDPASLPSSSEDESEVEMTTGPSASKKTHTKNSMSPISASSAFKGPGRKVGPIGRGRGPSSDLDTSPRSIVDLAGDEDETDQVPSQPASRELRTRSKDLGPSGQQHIPSKKATKQPTGAHKPAVQKNKDEEVMIPVKTFTPPKPSPPKRVPIKRSQSQTKITNAHGARHTKFDDDDEDDEMIMRSDGGAIKDDDDDSLKGGMSPETLASSVKKRPSIEVQILPESSPVVFNDLPPSMSGSQTRAYQSSSPRKPDLSPPARELRSSPRAPGRMSIMRDQPIQAPPSKKNTTLSSSSSLARTHKPETFYGVPRHSSRLRAPETDDTEKGGEKRPIELD